MNTSMIETDADVDGYLRWFWADHGEEMIQALWPPVDESRIEEEAGVIKKEVDPEAPKKGLGFVFQDHHLDVIKGSRVQLFKGHIDGPLYSDVMKWKRFGGSITKSFIPFTGDLDEFKYRATILQFKRCILAERRYKNDGRQLAIFKPLSEKIHGSPMPKKSRPTLE